LDRWAWLLLISRAPVLDVALETGFENHETFTRAFQTRFGVTLSAFRKNRGNTRCTFHRRADTSATAEGWRLLFQDGFKSWIERIK
jgi:AraC-like DNA-binding protein